MSDLKKFQAEYKEHRERVLKATAKVDTSPPEYEASKALNLTRLKEDHATFQERKTQDLRVFTVINEILRTGGVINSFRSARSVQGIRSNLVYNCEKVAKIDKANLILGERILNATAKVESRRADQKSCPPPFIVAPEIIEKFPNLNFTKVPSNPWLRMLMRPVVYFEMIVRQLRPIGRVYMQLYTEACPQIVLELVRVCAQGLSEQTKMSRMYEDLWMEVEVLLQNDVINSESVEFDERALDMDSAAGILTFSKQMVHKADCGPNNLLNFSVAFDPIGTAKGRRIAFGRMLNPNKALDCLRNFATKNGKPTKTVEIIDIGLVGRKERLEDIDRRSTKKKSRLSFGVDKSMFEKLKERRSSINMSVSN